MTVGWKILLASAALSAAFVAGSRYEGARKDVVIASMQADQAREREREALAQVNAVDRARLEERAKRNAQQEAINDAIKQRDQAQAAARAADAAGRELRARATALANAARRPAGAATVASCEAAENAAVVLADLFGRADARAGDLAEFADAAHIPGQACERSYDALTVAQAAE